MAAITLSSVTGQLLKVLRMSPEERRAMREDCDAALASTAAAEAVRYNAMSDVERADYDRLTEGMMTHLPGAQWGNRDPRGGR